MGGATPLAQGGLAAALGAGDTPAAHVCDTLTAGVGLCEPDVVAALAARRAGRDRVAGRARRAAGDPRPAAGGRAQRTTGSCTRATTRPGPRCTGRCSRRCSPAGSRSWTARSRSTWSWRTGRGDAADGARAAGTGTGPRAADGAAAASAGPVCRHRRRTPVRLQPARVAGAGGGVIGADGRLTAGVIGARAVVIAAGGLGQAFGTTSNPAGATGDGIAIAARAGAVIRDLEFVQFHPTVLWLPGASGQCPLITEALRGAGAVLRDLDGTPLMAGHDPRGDLAPRDVVAARMAEVIAAGTRRARVARRDRARRGRAGKRVPDRDRRVPQARHRPGDRDDPRRARRALLVRRHLGRPGRADQLAGLYAVGEAASTGVQGANRLASNSVTEAIIAGRRTGAAVAETLPGASGQWGGVAAESGLWHPGLVRCGLGAHRASGFWPCGTQERS